ncbi:MAG: hypothetical protein IPH18_10030 [Chitinophagaceae bacterium]|nr:hypothetical protein [Chitinophagaceae bacterium]
MVGEHRVEVYSVDEAFLDIGMIPDEQLETAALHIKETVEQWTGIEVSVGVAPSKVLSKVANRLAKKDKKGTGCVMVLDTEDKIREALLKTDVADIWGVGYRYSVKLKERYSIYNAWQLGGMSTAWAQKNLGGVVGVQLIKELNGEPCKEMKDP